MHLLLSAISLIFRVLPHGLAHVAGAKLGWIWFYLIPVRRKVALDNLRMSMPKLSEKQRRRIARACFVHIARCGVEFLRLFGLTRKKAERLVEFVGWEHLEQALQRGQGVITVTAHLGNFDLMACVAAQRGLPLHVVTREQRIQGFQQFWISVRSRFGLGFVPVKDSAFNIHRLLKNNQVVAMMIDQHMPPGRGIELPFFGRLASTTHAPALFAWLSKAPIVPVVAERLSGGRHRVSLEPAIMVNRGAQRQDEIKRLTEWFNAWLESKIEKRPEQWLWIHRRWKI